MPFPIIPASTVSTGYRIARSLRFRSSASAYLSRTYTTPTDNKKWTFSCWVKGNFYNGTSYTHLFGTGAGSTDTTSNQLIWIGTGSTLNFSLWSISVLTTNAVYRDPSAWYHIMLVVDNANATASNRAKIYVNGVEPTYSTDNRASLSTSTNYAINSGIQHTIGRWAWNAFAQPEQFDGYVAETYFIDGQALTPSSFGETDATTGVWKPKAYTGTYGTNGFYLKFADNSGATATTIGKDSSGNGNNWTPNNISVTAGVTYDSMIDTPTPYDDGGNGVGNYAVLNPLSNSGTTTYSAANLNVGSMGSGACSRGTIAISSGKWYWEATITAAGFPLVGAIDVTSAIANQAGYTANSAGYLSNGTIKNNGTNVGTAYATFTTNDVIGVALDMGGGSISFYKNGTLQATASGSISGTWIPQFVDWNTGGAGYAINFGQRPFAYTPPSGYKALNTQNLPTPTIAAGNKHFDATTYTGNGGAQSAVNSGSMQPDFLWIKGRSAATDHQLLDVIRGANATLVSNTTGAETVYGGAQVSFNSNGFTVGGLSAMNTNAATYVGWQWKANGAGTDNNSGSITSKVSANTTAGFSVVTFTTPASGNFTVGHGLGVAPNMFILKTRSGVDGWYVYHSSFATPASQYLSLNGTGAVATSTSIWGNTNPTSTVLTLGTGAGIAANATGLLYCFASVAGYSAFGSYTGNGSSDGPFVFTGFRPRYILAKRTDTTSDWRIHDTSRATYNVDTVALMPNLSSVEDTGSNNIDVLSNGFKMRDGGAFNTSSGTYIYAAFAENPFKYSLAR